MDGKCFLKMLENCSKQWTNLKIVMVNIARSQTMKIKMCHVHGVFISNERVEARLYIKSNFHEFFYMGQFSVGCELNSRLELIGKGLKPPNRVPCMRRKLTNTHITRR